MPGWRPGQQTWLAEGDRRRRPDVEEGLSEQHGDSRPFAEIVEEIKKAGGEAFKFCYQCGKCDVVCPWNRVTDFSIRKIIRQAALGTARDRARRHLALHDLRFLPGQVSAGRRADRGRGRDPPDRHAYGVFPAPRAAVRTASGSLVSDGNPLGEERTSGTPGRAACRSSRSPRAWRSSTSSAATTATTRGMQKVAVATAKILNKAGVDFGILGSKESCCGESIRKTGNEEVFKTLAKENIKAFIDNGVKRILVSSPHCYHTFKNEYPEFMVNFEVVHITQFLAELIEQGRLELAGRVRQAGHLSTTRATWGGTTASSTPRDVLKKLPGLELVEMPDSRARQPLLRRRRRQDLDGHAQGASASPTSDWPRRRRSAPTCWSPPAPTASATSRRAGWSGTMTIPWRSRTSPRSSRSRSGSERRP